MCHKSKCHETFEEVIQNGNVYFTGRKLFGDGYSGLEYDYRGLINLYDSKGTIIINIMTINGKLLLRRFLQFAVSNTIKPIVTIIFVIYFPEITWGYPACFAPFKRLAIKLIRIPVISLFQTSICVNFFQKIEAINKTHAYYKHFRAKAILELT